MNDPIKQAMQEVETELRAATSRYAPFNSAHEGYAVTLEEVDELWEVTDPPLSIPTSCGQGR